MNKFKDKIKTIRWAFSLAWHLDKRMLLLWLGLSVGLAVLPAIALSYNREIAAQLSYFLTTGQGSFDDLIPIIILLGIILTVSGLSARINNNLVYMMMYDSYYLGVQEITMDGIQSIEMIDLLRKDINDEYRAIIYRPGSLTDFMSAFCNLAGKAVSIAPLLFVAWGASKVIFFISIVYIIGILFLNAAFVDKTRWSLLKMREIERVARYYENLPYSPGAAKEIRIFSNQETIFKLWEEAYAPIDQFEKKRSFAIELRSYISGAGFYMLLLIMIIYSIWDVSAGRMGPDIFLMIYFLCFSIFSAVSGVTHSFLQADYGLFSLERQRNFFKLHGMSLNKEHHLQDSEDIKLDTEIIFETKDLTFCYQEEKPVLQDINIKIYRGETIALIGCNGSGKSTLVKLLLGLYKPTFGQILFHGNPYTEKVRKLIKEHVGTFFQNFYLFHSTLSENVGFGDVARVSDKGRIMEAMEKGGATSLLNKMSHGLDTLLGRNVDKTGMELSGGEKQRVAISRTHMNNREVLIFDEPASMLDPIAEMEQFLNIKEKLDGRTAILISHRVGFARLADRIIVLDQGKIVEDGSHEALIAQNGAYAHFFNQQAQWYQQNPSMEVREQE